MVRKPQTKKLVRKSKCKTNKSVKRRTKSIRKHRLRKYYGGGGTARELIKLMRQSFAEGKTKYGYDYGENICNGLALLIVRGDLRIDNVHKPCFEFFTTEFDKLLDGSSIISDKNFIKILAEYIIRGGEPPDKLHNFPYILNDIYVTNLTSYLNKLEDYINDAINVVLEEIYDFNKKYLEKSETYPQVIQDKKENNTNIINAITEYKKTISKEHDKDTIGDNTRKVFDFVTKYIEEFIKVANVGDANTPGSVKNKVLEYIRNNPAVRTPDPVTRDDSSDKEVYPLLDSIKTTMDQVRQVYEEDVQKRVEDAKRQIQTSEAEKYAKKLQENIKNKAAACNNQIEIEKKIAYDNCFGKRIDDAKTKMTDFTKGVAGTLGNGVNQIFTIRSKSEPVIDTQPLTGVVPDATKNSPPTKKRSMLSRVFSP